MKRSKNKQAEELMGLRITDAIALFSPAETDYHCPVCDYPPTFELEGDTHYDERLFWSEYNAFIWCSVCNFDYPSALCKPAPHLGTEIFLQSVADAIVRKIGAASERK